MDVILFILGGVVGIVGTLFIARRTSVYHQDHICRLQSSITREISTHRDIKNLLIKLLKAKGWNFSHSFDGGDYLYLTASKTAKTPTVEVKSLHDAVMVEIGRG